jgi:RNA polymerase sigma-70 factor (ECF subfamily)
MIEDELLKLRFKAGSTDALRRIYEKYRDYLLTVAMALLNDAGLAEDILHDVFVSFAQSGARFRLRGSLRGYLATCVVNRARDHQRAQKRRLRNLDQGTPLGPDFDPPDKRIIADERSHQMAEALARLPDDQREAVALHLSAQMKLRHIARVQNVPLSTVRGRYRQGINKLRSILDGRMEP